MMKTIYVSQTKLEELYKLYSGDTIAESRKLRGIGRVNNQEIFISGGVFLKGETNHLSGSMLIHLSNYKGEHTPLPYHEHNLEVNAGKRARGYEGMKVSYRGVEYVCGEKLRIETDSELPKGQLKLF